MAGKREFLRPFASVFGAGDRNRPISSTLKEKLAAKMPDPILSLLESDGIATYRDDALRTLNPVDWQDLVANWTDKFPDALPFAMTSFGDFYFWADRAVWVCFVQYARIKFCMESADSFLNDFLTDPSYLKDLELFERNNKARAAVGTRSNSEIYTWEPAFALGGSPDTSAIGKGNARVALKLLSQLQPAVVQDI